MTQTPAASGELDAEELLFLALQAMQQDRDEEAISCLKRGLVLEPDNGILHHLLGAMYAQLGMIDRAVDEMTRAVTCAPELHMARFQLGLLYFTSANLDAADQAWEPLSALPADNPLFLFRAGLLHLARDEFAQCVATLRHGLEINTEYPSLNEDMRMLAEKAEEAMDAAHDAAPPERPAAETRSHVLLSGYRDLSGNKKPN